MELYARVARLLVWMPGSGDSEGSWMRGMRVEEMRSRDTL